VDVTTLMRQAAQLNSRWPAVITESRTLTFAQAWERGARLANALRALGVQPGDRVGGLEDNNLGCADFDLGRPSPARCECRCIHGTHGRHTVT
jgi:acyl-CoA synthetase (AMP-forming)/AMP-acid ligase II